MPRRRAVAAADWSRVHKSATPITADVVTGPALDSGGKLNPAHLPAGRHYPGERKPVITELNMPAVPVSKPFAGYDNFTACVVDQTNRGHSMESAQRICGALSQGKTLKEAEAAEPALTETQKAAGKDRKADPGIMVALWPHLDVAKELAVDGGESADNMHLTLAYLGRLSNVGPENFQKCMSIVKEIALASNQVEGSIAGVGRFAASESSDNKDVLYASVDSPGLHELRHELVTKLAAAGVEINKEHGFTPHITLSYVDPKSNESLAPMRLPVVFKDITLSLGDEKHVFPLGNPVAKAALHMGKTFTEHAQKWVESKGLMAADSDYGGMLGKAVLNMAKQFASEGHSGMSAHLARAYFNWLTDAWDGLHTMMLNDKDFATAKDALEAVESAMAKMAKSMCDGAVEVEKTMSPPKPDLAPDEVQVAKALWMPIVKAEQRLITGVVLRPEMVDAQGDIVSAQVIKAAAHQFLMDYNKRTQMGVQHKEFPPGIHLVESWITDEASNKAATDIPAGSWMIKVFVDNPAVWAKVESGAIRGFSIGGMAKVKRLSN